MRPGGKSNGESPFFETPNLSFEGRVRNVAHRCAADELRRLLHIAAPLRLLRILGKDFSRDPARDPIAIRARGATVAAL